MLALHHKTEIDPVELSKQEPYIIPAPLAWSDVPPVEVPMPRSLRSRSSLKTMKSDRHTPQSSQFLKDHHSSGCKNRRGEFIQTPIQGDLLYPSAEIHCRIFSDLLRYHLRGSTDNIFNLDHKHITGPLQTLSFELDITPRDLCCKAQVDAIRDLLVIFHSNPISTAKVIGGSYTDDCLLRQCNRISNFVSEEYKKEGFEFFYFCFVNTKHPFHMAAISKLPLNSVTFEMCANTNSIAQSKTFSEKLKNVSGIHALSSVIRESGKEGNNGKSNYGLKPGFSKRQLMNAIRDTALAGVGASTLSKYKQDNKIRKVLNLSTLTGVPAHKNILIPGIGITVADESVLKKLRKTGQWNKYNDLRDMGSINSVSKSWLEYVYRILANTTWTIPTHVVSVQPPEVMEYIYETLLHIEYKPCLDWKVYVLENRDNPYYVSRLPLLNSDDLVWVLDPTGRYLPLLDSDGEYKICPSYNTSIESLRSRAARDGYLASLKTEAILYLVSEFLRRPLTVKELHMSRDFAISFLLRIVIYGKDYKDKSLFDEEREYIVDECW